MTDQRPASPVNLFRSSASSLTPAGNGLSAFDLDPAQGGVFSKELSRASQRAASSSEPSGWRKDPSRDAVERRNTQASESSHRSDAPQRQDTGSQASQGHSKASSRSSDSTEQRADNTRNSTTSSNSPSKTDAADRTATSAENSGPDATHRAESAEADTPEGIDSAVSVQENLNGAVDTEDENALMPDAEQLSAGLSGQIVNEESLSETSNEAQASVMPAANDTTASDIAARTVASPVGAGVVETRDDVEGISNVSKPAVHRMAMGEQLSPAELANRQVAMASVSAQRDRHGVEPVTSGMDAQEGAPDAPLLRPSGVVAATGTVAGVQGRLVSVDSETAEQRPGTQGLPPVDSQTLQDANVAIQNDKQLQANAQEQLLARKMEQQAAAANLMQSKQLAQQQGQSGVLAPVTADNGSQTPDNMFLALPGGIVTAPLLHRADAGNAQSINAPVNMPILQNDADKAMASNIRWMVNEGVKSAMVSVTPSGMGPISVSIGLENEQMNVSIVALQGSTREALDSMLPRLREQLAAQGHDSIKVDISDGRPEESDRGYSQQFSGEQADAESGFASADRQADLGGVGSNGPDDELPANVPQQGMMTLPHNGQIRSSYDVYV